MQVFCATRLVLLLFEWAWQRRVPLAMCMAGGYGTRIEDTVQVQVNTFASASEY